MITVKNLRCSKPMAEWQVRVDRSSVLGNPFYMATEAQRDVVCDKYAKYFEVQIVSNPAFKAELDRLFEIYTKYKKLELFCWCAPRRCHAETIKKYLERRYSNG